MSQLDPGRIRREVDRMEWQEYLHEAAGPAESRQLCDLRAENVRLRLDASNFARTAGELRESRSRWMSAALYLGLSLLAVLLLELLIFLGAL